MTRPGRSAALLIVMLAAPLAALARAGGPEPAALAQASGAADAGEGTLPPAAPTAAKPLVIDGGTIVDVSRFGTSGADVPDAVVVIEGGEIAAAGPRGRVEIPPGATILDARGTYLVPGLHDLFATVNNQAQANAYLAMGVTSIVGIEGPRRGRLDLSADPSPRIYRFDALSGYDESSVPPERLSFATLLAEGRRLSEDELVAQVERLAQEGVRFLLLHYAMSPPQVRAAARRARELGLATVGELGATTYREAIAAGVMAFVHTSRYSLDLAPEPLRSEVAGAPFGPPRLAFYEFLNGVDLEAPVVRDHAALLAQAGVGLIPTLALVYLELPGHANPWDEPAAALLDPADIHLPADRATGEPQRPADGTRDRFPQGTAQRMVALEAVYCRAGAKYLAGSGTDAFGTLPGIALHIELAMLVDACLTPRQALAAATGNVGELFPWPKVGQVKAGYAADLLILEANPTVDIANLKKIRRVVLGGEVLDPQVLIGAGVSFEALARRCVAERLEDPLCAEAKLAAIARQRAPGEPGGLVCKGGFQDGEACSTSADCAEEAVCWQGPRHGERCTTNRDCNAGSEGSDLCFHAPTQVCDPNDPVCPGVCEDSGAPCNDDSDCPDHPLCVGGKISGAPCQEPPLIPCPGTCVDSPLAGDDCSVDAHCTVCLCSGSTADGQTQASWSCSNTPPPCFFPQCRGGPNEGQPCDFGSCPNGVCITQAEPTHPGECADVGTCDPGEVRCREQWCLNDWVVCIGRGHCVPEGALGFAPN